MVMKRKRSTIKFTVLSKKKKKKLKEDSHGAMATKEKKKIQKLNIFLKVTKKKENQTSEHKYPNENEYHILT